ncbi:leucine-rich repeat, cysteine-containing subtype protein, partial [Tanacetum coccineum]
NEDLNSVSLVSKKFFDNDSLTRKHLTVHVHFAPDPKRVSHRFPNIESLTIKSYSHGPDTAEQCHIPVTPWIHEIALTFTRLNSLSIRNMVVSAFDLKRLAKTRGDSLTSLEIRGCKMFSEDGLMYVARHCKDLRNLRLDCNDIDGRANGKWLRKLSLRNTVMESLYFHDPFDLENLYDMKDVRRLAKKCSESLVSLNVFPNYLSEFRKVFKRAKKLLHFGTGIIHEGRDYRGFEFPRNIHGLRIERFDDVSYRFLRPYLNQLRELDLQCGDDFHPNCQCLFFKNCPSLEVLRTDDKCGDKGFQFIGRFCKKLRKLNHFGPVTHVGLKAVAQGCPDLDYLEVHPFKISNKALECVGNHLKKLRDFRIFFDIDDGITVGQARILDKGVRAMLEGCRKLERLDIELYLGGLTNVGLGYIGEYGHNLRHLSLSYTGKSDAGLRELLKGCPKLRKLKLEGWTFSEQAIATSVFNLNHSLRHVWIVRDPADVLVLTRPVVSAKMGESHNHTKEVKEEYEGGVESKVCCNEEEVQMADKDIVKGAFKTFQNRVNQLPSSDGTSTRPKQLPTKGSELKVSTSMASQKENERSSEFWRKNPKYHEEIFSPVYLQASRDLFTIETPLGLIQMGETRKEKASEAERSRLDDLTEDNLQEVACPSRSDDHTPEDKEEYEGGVEIKVCRNEKEVQADIFAVEGSGKHREDKPASSAASSRRRFLFMEQMERKDAEMKKLRQILTFMAKPMPSFYRAQGASKTTSEKMGETCKEKASEAERSRLDDLTEDILQEVACPSRSDDHTPEDKEEYEGGVEIKVCRNEKEVQADIFAVEGSGK